MNAKSSEVLEYPKVLAQLAEHTSFSLGHELALRLRPSSREKLVKRRQQETSEAKHLLDLKPALSLGGVINLRPLLKKARLEATLMPGELLDIRSTLLSGRSLRRSIAPLERQFPILAERAEEIEECAELAKDISQVVNDRAEITDTASPALARIRREVKETHDQLLERLERIVSSPANSHFLQENIITERHGRYVIPLKADFKGRIPGIVHDQSASGATLFIEPLATLELNNRWRQVQLDEEREVERLLRQLTACVADEEEAIQKTLRALAALDLAFAKARHSLAMRGIEPELVPFRDGEGKGEGLKRGFRHPGSTIRLLRARHPLLPSSEAVPIDIHIDDDFFIVIITGPNTGGKTVSLKTVGLLALMAQAGLHIPAADGSALSVFRGIYADIGEEQSIEQSLSTFSSHMTKIVDILSKAYRESLVLLDELGAGTDPIEGSALARAILSHLHRRRITTLVATHYSDLKVHAHATPGVRNASVEFDAQTLAPTFKLSIGLPGQSNALAIATGLGLSREIVNQARDSISPEDLEVESLLTDIKNAREDALAANQAAQAARAEAEQAKQELEERLVKIEEDRREILNRARQQAKIELGQIRKKLRDLSKALRPQARPRELVESRAKLKELEETVEPLEPPVKLGPIDREELGLGRTVWVRELRRRGEITDFLSEEEVEIGVGKFRVKARLDDLELVKEEPQLKREDDGIISPPAVATPMSLHLRGQRAEEAIIELDKYLDRAFLARLPSARIVHGKGTGALRRAVREELDRHRLVASHRPGVPEEGGDGVTIAEFVE